MRKLKLEDLEVDSFATSDAVEGRKTVRGYAQTAEEFCTAYVGCTQGCTGGSCFDCTEDFGCSHDCQSAPFDCSETYTGACQQTCDMYACSNNFTCPWGYPSCGDICP